jgi:hypothetical protein
VSYLVTLRFAKLKTYESKKFSLFYEIRRWNVLFSVMNNITRKANQIFLMACIFAIWVCWYEAWADEKLLSICTDVQKLMFIILVTYKYTLCNPVVWYLHLCIKIILLKRI